MRIHPTDGRVLHGIGGEGVYLDGVQVAPGGGWSGMAAWWGDRIVYAGRGYVRSCRADGSDDRNELINGSPVPAGFMVASSSGWATWAWDDQNPIVNGVVRSDGLRLPRAVLFDMAPDGTMLVGDDYQAGVGISAYKAGSLTSAWTVPGARPGLFFPYPQAAILDARTACWTEDVNGRRVIKEYGLPPAPRPPWNVLHLSLLRVNGEAWVGYLRGEDDLVIAHPWDYRGLGVCVPNDEPHYGPTAAVVNGKMTLFWSTGAGEKPGEIKSKPFDLAELEEIPSLPKPTPAPTPVPPKPIAPAGPLDIVGTFFGVNDMPGNAIVWVSNPDGSPRELMPESHLIIAPPSLAKFVPADRLVGIFSGADEASIDIARPLAELYRVPLYLYHDDRTFPEFDDVKRWARGTPVILCPQFYFRCGGREAETMDEFKVSIKAQSDRMRASGLPWIPVVRVTTGAWTDRERTNPTIPPHLVAEALNYIAAACLAGALGLLTFAWRRDDGIDSIAALTPFGVAWMSTPYRIARNAARAFADRFFPPVVTPVPVPTPTPVPVPVPGNDMEQLGAKARKRLIELLYEDLLGRLPDPTGIDIYTQRLLAGWTAADMEADIKASPEYKARNPQ